MTFRAARVPWWKGVIARDGGWDTFKQVALPRRSLLVKLHSSGQSCARRLMKMLRGVCRVPSLYNGYVAAPICFKPMVTPTTTSPRPQNVAIKGLNSRFLEMVIARYSICVAQVLLTFVTPCLNVVTAQFEVLLFISQWGLEHKLPGSWLAATWWG